jgi:glycerol kinase
VTEPLVLALDQGTSSSRAILFDRSGAVVASASREFPQLFPSPGHVLHDPEAIWESQLAVAREVLERAGIGPGEVGRRVAAVGIANQRETTVVWERATGRAVAPAIVWQSRITAPYCEELRAAGHEPLVRERTGLPLDAYFSGPKIRHILRSEPGLRERAARGELCFGTVDSFLAWRLTGGRLHVTDVSNASRTLLFDIRRLAWDDELLALMGIPRAMLPEVRSSSERYGTIEPELLGAPLPIGGIAGDQQAATFGQACHRPGMAKNTYGTGAFLMLNTGGTPVASSNGLLTTVGWQLGPGAAPTYALEGAVFVAGAAVQWLRDGLRAIATSGEVEALADSVADTGGVYLVPAFTGLGAPWWDPYARGTIVGLTRGTGLAEIARATVDSMAYGVADLLDAVSADLAVAGGDLALEELRVDGGAAVNDRLLGFQAGLLGVPVVRPTVAETTALGAAYLAGLATGVWSDVADVSANWRLDRTFRPSLDPAERDRLRRGWRRAVERSLRWAEPD